MKPTDNQTKEQEAFHEFWDDLYQQWSIYGKLDKNDVERELFNRIQSERTKAQIEELDNIIGIYNRQNEPNGEFKSFGQMTKTDVANLYLAIGERIRLLSASTEGDDVTG
jgi:hypothetical protein